jgi:hypothetical protein
MRGSAYPRGDQFDGMSIHGHVRLNDFNKHRLFKLTRGFIRYERLTSEGTLIVLCLQMTLSDFLTGLAKGKCI